MKITNFEIYIPKQPQVPDESKPSNQPSDTLKHNTQKPLHTQNMTQEVVIDSTINVPPGSHLVQPKETLYSIANHYGTTVAEIIALNPDLATDKNGNKIIKSGSVIKVMQPQISQETSCVPDEELVYGSWKIEAGKGAYSVMTKFNLFREELELLNPEIDLNNIKKDEIFKVPGYKVKTGDSMYEIAKSHDITIEMLKELNPGHSETLKPGEILNVPKLAGQELKSEVPAEVSEEVPETISEQPERLTHTVKNGEALSKIAEKYNVPMWALMLHNDIENEDRIFKNQILEIPTEEEISQLEALKNKPEEKPATYKVQKGDTLSEIALKHNVSVENLKEWNNLKSDKLDIGKVLRLSKPDDTATHAPQARNVQYTVKEGDVLSKIALKYGVSTASIMYKNNIQNPKHIQPNQVIIIPDKTEAAELEAAQRAIKSQQNSQAPQRKKVSDSKSVNTPSNTISANRGIVVHKVKRGDTLSDVSKKYNIPVKDLMLYNDNLRGVKSSDKLSEKEIKTVRIIATKDAVIDATGVSEEFINDLISIEKKRNRLYNDDCGIPTIGIGHNTKAHGDTSFYRGKTLSDNQVYSLLARDIFDAQNKIRKAIGKDAFDSLSRGQKEALYGLVFNTGGLHGSPKLAEALKSGDYVEAACQMDQACGTINGRQQVLPGLAKRRFMDIARFIEGSRFSRSEVKTIMSALQTLYNKGFNNIERENTKVDYNAYAKKFLGSYIDKGWITLRS